MVFTGHSSQVAMGREREVIRDYYFNRLNVLLFSFEPEPNLPE